MTSKFTELAVDCADPGGLARFWCAVLDYEVQDEDDGVVTGGPQPHPAASQRRQSPQAVTVARRAGQERLGDAGGCHRGRRAGPRPARRPVPLPTSGSQPVRFAMTTTPGPLCSSAGSRSSATGRRPACSIRSTSCSGRHWCVVQRTGTPP
ncbi:VOC family protein [Streptomyces sp. NPDC095613]|uniref:VOC family protein n=1 Tax=Streptomyces sp. NPDC095613 TaxID=3155540 RepID=UPI00332BB0DB